MRMRYLIAVSLAMILLLVVVGPARVFALEAPLSGSGSGQSNESTGTVTIQATNTSSTPAPVASVTPVPSSGGGGGGSGGGGSSSPGPCGGGQSAAYQGAGPAPAWPIAGTPVPAGSVVQNLYCNGSYSGTNIVPIAGGGGGGAPAPVVINPAQLAQTAISQIRLSAPQLQLSPAPNITQYVNSPTWAWMPMAQWAPLTATAAAGPVVVTATATPLSIRIDYTDAGSPHTATCNGPGTPFSVALADQEDPQAPFSAASPDCGWTFTTTSADQPGGRDAVSATVTYGVGWTVTGAPGGGNLGPLNSPPVRFSLPVGEIEVLNTQ